MELTIIEKNGWKKSVVLNKAIIRIGSSEASDIQLASPEIAPVQLQLNYLESNPSTCKVLNIGSEVSVVQNQKEMVLPGYATAEIGHGTEIILGEYRVQFNLPFAARLLRESISIVAELSFSNASLHPKRHTVGNLRLRNAGLESACQFEVMLSGLPVDCMQVDPVPVLYPGAEENIRVQLIHQGLYPSAGAQELTVTVASPNSYPGEQVIIQHGIYVYPLLAHDVVIDDDLQREEVPSQKSTTLEEKRDDPRFVADVLAPESGAMVETPAPLSLMDDINLDDEKPDGEMEKGSVLIEPESKPNEKLEAYTTEPVVKQLEENVPVPVVVKSTPAPDIQPQISKPEKEVVEDLIVEDEIEEDISEPEDAQIEPESKSPPRPKPKLVQSASEDFWNDEE